MTTTTKTTLTAGGRNRLTAADRERRTDGKFAREMRCDGCGGTIKNNDYMTDDEVCGDSDGPGFLLCERVRCDKKRNALSVDARRDMYAAQRAKNAAAQ